MNAEYDDGVLHFFVNYNMYVEKLEEKIKNLKNYTYFYLIYNFILYYNILHVV